MDNNHEVIFCIVNAGFSELVMDAAKEAGARGGTVIHARGTANKEAEQYFQISIQPDKDIVMILVPHELKDAVLHSLYRNAGLKTAGQGIAFSMPVSNVVGLSGPAKPNEHKEEHNDEKKGDGNHEQSAKEQKAEGEKENTPPAQEQKTEEN